MTPFQIRGTSLGVYFIERHQLRRGGGGLFCESKDPSNHGSNFNDDATATSKTVNAVRIEHQEETGKVDFCSMDI